MLSGRTLPGVSESRNERERKYGKGSSLLCQDGERKGEGTRKICLGRCTCQWFYEPRPRPIIGPWEMSIVTRILSCIFGFAHHTVSIIYSSCLCPPRYQLLGGDTTTPSISMCVVKQHCASRDDSARPMPFDAVSTTWNMILADMML